MTPDPSPWFYNGRPVTDEDVAPPVVGFVYIIRDLVNGRYYIGQKTVRSRRKQPLRKGQTRARHKVVESDWREYFGSSRELQDDIERNGRERYRREILSFHASKGALNYAEMREQIMRDVLRDPLSYNSFVGGRINRSHVSDKVRA